MKVAIVGAGAIGLWIGAKLGLAGHQLSVYARGATLDAVRAHGVRLEQGGEVVAAPAVASDDAASLGVQDLIVVAVKGPALAAVAPAVAAMIGPETIVLPAMNGVPWWFLHGLEGPLSGASLDSVDPGGVIAAAVPTARVIGCVVHAACGVAQPGLARHRMGNGLIVGEPAGGASKRLDALAADLAAAGFDVTVSPKVQQDIWYKLWGNMTMNPISAITGADCAAILDDELISGFIVSIMGEASGLGARIGLPIGEAPQDRNAVTRKLGAFKTSMLQDVEAGRAIELDALLAAPREIAQRLGLPTPGMDALLGLTRLMGRVRGLYA